LYNNETRLRKITLSLLNYVNSQKILFEKSLKNCLALLRITAMVHIKYIFIGILIGSMISTLIFVGLIYENQPHENKISSLPDTIYIAQEPEIQVERVVEKVNIKSNDTIMLLTNINQNIDSGDYVVLRDKLLLTRSINILSKNKDERQNPSDVLIERINTDNFFSDRITVEFWESPIEYQGYRLNKTKLILFGINPNDFFELVNTNEGHLMMKSGGQTAILYPTEKYRNFNFQ
jgi:hypothetical protein